MSANPFSAKPHSVPVNSPDFEVLPPDQPPRAVQGNHQAMVSHLIAYFMDNLLRVPGTKARIGLTPIIEFYPLAASCPSVTE